MRKKLRAITIILASIFFMYQETPAEAKRSTKVKASPSARAQAAPDIGYTVSMPRPATHLLEVEMRLKWNRMPAATQLKMPVWTPGSYLIREYARHVQDFAVKDATG